mmetsp:Transcript_126961/g.219757  ORF Transcript_126961/g.219757 Transcript_126961/m.219757 type:complete len:179 (-) Transcript_126961:774-1310(-)
MCVSAPHVCVCMQPTVGTSAQRTCAQRVRGPQGTAGRAHVLNGKGWRERWYFRALSASVGAQRCSEGASWLAETDGSSCSRNPNTLTAPNGLMEDLVGNRMPLQSARTPAPPPLVRFHLVNPPTHSTHIPDWPTVLFNLQAAQPADPANPTFSQQHPLYATAQSCTALHPLTPSHIHP